MSAPSSKQHGNEQPGESSIENPAAQRIVAAARSHFFTHGFRGVTMDDLAGELGMSKKTIYLHFSSKDSLLRAVLLDKFRDAQASLERIASERPSDFLYTLQQSLACMRRHTEEIRPPFLRDMQREAPELFKLGEIRRRELIRRHFGKLLTEGRRSGMIREDVPDIMIIEVLLGAVQAIMNPPKMAELGLTPTAGLTYIITVVLEGVLTVEGRMKR